MPTYEYRCNACRREFEIVQKMSDPDLSTCEVCGEDKLEKLISWTSFQLKGGGWYKDLYASTPSQGGSSSASSDGGASAASGAASGSSDGAGSSGASSSGSSDSSAS